MFLWINKHWKQICINTGRLPFYLLLLAGCGKTWGKRKDKRKPNILI